VLLACGVASSAVYGVAHDVLAAMLYPGYSPFSQAVSELSSIGAPTRAAVSVVSLMSDLLLIAFGIGVWQSAKGNRPLRVTGGLLIAYGATWPLWLPFPITPRGESDTTPAGHIILGAVMVLLMLSAIGFGAAALGKGFRLYSLVTLAAVLVFGALNFVYVDRVAAAEPTPWLGVVERITIGVWLLWVAVLAVVMLRAQGRAPKATPVGETAPEG
jgi:hypothetical protein